MKLKDFKKRIDDILSATGRFSRDVEDLEVVVVTSDPSIGAHSSTKVIELHEGFDWDSGKLQLITEKEVVFKNSPLQIEMKTRQTDMYQEIQKAATHYSKSTELPGTLTRKILNIIDKYNEHKERKTGETRTN